jgi:hypothetical protein
VVLRVDLEDGVRLYTVQENVEGVSLSTSLEDARYHCHCWCGGDTQHPNSCDYFHLVVKCNKNNFQLAQEELGGLG